jgi:ABC-type phosphate transport system substrate-binding protein
MARLLHSFLKRALLLGMVLSCLMPLQAAAELVLVVNPQSGVDQLTKSQAINIFLGRHRELPNGAAAVPIDLPAANPEKALFYQWLVQKDLNQMAAYWSRFVFAGSTAPPIQGASTQDVLQFVSNNRGAVAYLDRKSVDARVKVVLTLD